MELQKSVNHILLKFDETIGYEFEFYIALMVILALVITRRKTAVGDVLGGVPLCIIVLVWINPIFAYIVNHILVSYDIYYRALWTVPLDIIIAFSITYAYHIAGVPVKKAVLLIVFVLCVCCRRRFSVTEGYDSVVVNHYPVEWNDLYKGNPNAVKISEMIRSNQDYAEKKVFTDSFGTMALVVQYDWEIEWFFNYENRAGISSSGDIVKYMRENGLNYAVFSYKIEERDMKLLGTTGTEYVYVMRHQV